MDAMIKDKTKSKPMSSKNLGKYLLKTVKSDEAPRNRMCLVLSILPKQTKRLRTHRGRLLCNRG